MRHAWIAGAAALVLAAGTVGIARAQEQGEQKSGPSAAPRAERAPRVAPQRSEPRVERPAQRVERAPRVERTPRAERTPRVEVERTPRAERRPQPRIETKRAEPRTKQVDQPRKGPEQPERAERKRQDLPKQAAPQRQEGPAAKQAQTPGRQQINRQQVTNDQRVRVREEILRGKYDRVSRREFRGQVAVGSRVDRRHRRHLYRLTPAILAFAPIYAGYSYIVVDDSICIVDPETYYVVDVIPADTGYAYGPGSAPPLRLTAEEMRFIYANAPRDEVADVRVRLALGAEIPARVDLLGFPSPLVEHIPQLEMFRYIVVEDDIVIVDPKERSVVLVITE